MTTETATAIEVNNPVLEAQDPYFDEKTKAALRRTFADIEAGRNLVCHDIIETPHAKN
ncbi:MAG: hypothetical protein LBQ86_03570 [Holophagales bacterium]|jgi:hypothetical protein|nr:hypothetical protein [Holophagales bacterium]